jgi:hypothetical protein
MPADKEAPDHPNAGSSVPNEAMAAVAAAIFVSWRSMPWSGKK